MPKGPRKFHFSFEKVGLTRFGGLSLFQSFCKSLGLRHFLQLYVRWPDYHRRNYHPADLFLAHLFSMVAGIGRIENAQSLIHNGLIPPLLGLPEVPHRDTLRSFLWRFGPNEFDNLVAAHDRLRHDFFHRLGLLHSAIVDADTTALLTYGHQEGVAVGFVPKKRHGQPSYAPIISSEGRCGLTLGMELRAGNVHPTIGALSFLNQMLDKLPSSIAATRTRLRLDGAFYDRKIIEAIDQQRIGYAVSAKMTRPLRNKMIAARYQPFAQGWEAAAFSYMPFRWQKQHRFVAVRRAAALEPESIQQRLFTFKQYTYHQALVTNLEPTRRRFGVFTATGDSRSFCCASSRAPIRWRKFRPAVSGPMLPTWRWFCGLTIWSWRSNTCACPKKYATGTLQPCDESFGGCLRSGSDGKIATSW